MNINKTAGKLAGVLLGGAVLAGIGAGTALATPAPATHPAASHQAATHPAGVMSYPVGVITNETPYTWTLVPSGQPGGDHATQTVAPQQIATFDASQGINDSGRLFQYTFTDSKGGHDAVTVQVNNTGRFTTYSVDGRGNDSPDFHMQNDTDHNPLHVDAVWNDMVQVTNNTSGTWTLDYTNETGPEQTVAPGDTAWWVPAPVSGVADTQYVFDYQGEQERVEIEPHFNPTGLSSFSWADRGTPSAYYHMQNDPDGNPMHVDAVMNY